MRFPLKFVIAVSVLLLCMALPTVAQQELAGARITRSGQDVIVSVDASRPLYFTALALAERYGWVFDYEDPAYSGTESRDETDPTWRKNHPGAQGFLAPSGGNFTADLGPIDEEHPDEMEILLELVRQYNQSGNPGYFRVVRTESNRISLVGRSRSQSGMTDDALLDRKIEISSVKQTAGDALKQLTIQCAPSDASSLVLGTLPHTILGTSMIDRSLHTVSCREHLSQILDGLTVPLNYALLYDIGSHTFVLNIVPARRLIVGTNGKTTSVPIRRLAPKPQ